MTRPGSTTGRRWGRRLRPPVSKERFCPLRRGGIPASTVFVAEDLTRAQPCAIKRIYPQFLGAGRLDDALREAADAAILGHPAVLAPYESGYDDDGALCLVSELHPGESLRTRLLRGPLSAAVVMRYARS